MKRQRTHKRQWKKWGVKCRELAAAGKKTRAEERGSNHVLTTTIILKCSQQVGLKRAMCLKIWMADYIKWEKYWMKHCRWVKMLWPQEGMSGKCKVWKGTRQSSSNEHVPWPAVTVTIKNGTKTRTLCILRGRLPLLQGLNETDMVILTVHAVEMHMIL
jgi:hypothetical protein